MRRVASFIVASLAVFAMAGPAAADDAATCNNARADRDLSIAACTRLIDAGQLRGEILAAVLHNRGKRWAAKRDYERAYADFRAAFGHDPGSSDLLEANFTAAVITGDIDRGAELAQRIVDAKRNDTLARLVLAARAIKEKQYQTVRQVFAPSGRGSPGDLESVLLSAWALYGASNVRAATSAVDRLSGSQWNLLFRHYHAGLIFDLAGNAKEAGRRFEQAYKLDAKALRVVEAYGSWTARNGRKDEATRIFDGYETVYARHPVIQSALRMIGNDRNPPLQVGSAQAGAAEVFYGLAYSRRENPEVSLLYLHLALYLAPEHELARYSLGEFYEADNPQLAVKTYEGVAQDSPLRRHTDIQIAFALDKLDRTDEAKARLQKLIAENPMDRDALLALGNLLRGRKQFAEAGEAYSKVIAQIATPKQADWTTFYFRGICFERTEQWDKAEVDLKKALELLPDQPHVLNYLGYSWIDQGMHLHEGLRMIRRAIEQRPDDGYMVDSLGWAHYRLGNFDEALKHIRRALELVPRDPTIADHLGDAYWQLGGKAEARELWARAVSFKPDPKDLAKIEEKLRASQPAAVAPAPVVVAAPLPRETVAAEIGPQTRVALVIGNSAYASVSPLPNPRRDAQMVANALRSVGFQTVTLEGDLGRERLIQALRNFARVAEQADWALVYFAGHGIEINGINYLIPVDARLEVDRDAEFEAVELSKVMSAVDGAKRLRLVLLDACRDNPFTRSIKRSAGNTRSIGRGLASIEPEAGMLVVYAAKHGEVALDGDSVNSPFATALVKNIMTPNLEVRRLFDLVRDDVIDMTSRRQQPFSYGSVPGRHDFYFLRQ